MLRAMANKSRRMVSLIRDVTIWMCDQDRIAYSSTAAAATVRSVKVSALLTKCFTNAIEHLGKVYGCRWAI
eukprot:14258480-Heterocapsa_arctica.AAC.1